MCGEPYHRYATGDPEHDYNPIACINTLRDKVEKQAMRLAQLMLDKIILQGDVQRLRELGNEKAGSHE